MGFLVLMREKKSLLTLFNDISTGAVVYIQWAALWYGVAAGKRQPNRGAVITFTQSD